MNVLILWDGFISTMKPSSWNHVTEQVKVLSNWCNITMISPIMVPPPLPKYAAEKRHLEETYPYTGQIGSVRFYQPRYIDLPRGSYRYNEYSRIASIIGCLFRERIPVDFIHAHFAYWPGYAGGIVGKILRKPVLLTVYGSDIHQMTKPDFHKPLWRTRVLKALRSSERIIALSNALKEMIKEFGYYEKTDVISIAFNCNYFRVLDKKQCRHSLGLNNNAKIILYIGNMLMVKGTDVGIQAFKLLVEKQDNILFVLIGDGDLRQDLEKAIQQAGLSEKAFFLGRVKNSNLAEQINAADILMVPSRNEGGGPVVAMESLACGTPVVATRVGGIPELIIDEELGILVEPENPKALAEGISVALERSWDRNLLNSHAQQYSWENIAPKIYKIYSEMVN